MIITDGVSRDVLLFAERARLGNQSGGCDIHVPGKE